MNSTSISVGQYVLRRLSLKSGIVLPGFVRLAKWKDRQRLAKARPQSRSCIVCGESVVGCSADDECPATLLCVRHFWVQAEGYGDAEGFGLFEGRKLSPEADLKDFERWRPVFEAAMRRRGLSHHRGVPDG